MPISLVFTFAAAQVPTPPTTDDPLSFAAVLLLGLGLAALAIGRPIAKH